MANIGTCPTFDNPDLSLEVHLLEFSGDLYGENLSVQFVSRLREERRFSSIEALAAQIHADIPHGPPGLGRILSKAMRKDARQPAHGLVKKSFA